MRIIIGLTCTLSNQNKGCPQKATFASNFMARLRWLHRVSLIIDRWHALLHIDQNTVFSCFLSTNKYSLKSPNVIIKNKTVMTLNPLSLELKLLKHRPLSVCIRLWFYNQFRKLLQRMLCFNCFSLFTPGL